MIFWFYASPDGVIFDKKFQEIGLLEITFPYNKKNLHIESIITKKTFYIALNKDKKPYLKEEHHFGYYSQIEVAMGLAGLKWCHFVVYVHNGMIIVKVDFGRDYFKSVIDKMGLLHQLVIQYSKQWVKVIYSNSCPSNCNYLSFYVSLNQKFLDLEIEQRITNKIYKKVSLVPYMQRCLL